VFRSISWPTLANSRVMTDVSVKASAQGWLTDMYATGAYEGPNDIAACRDYRLDWQVDGGRLLEKGSATLLRASGRRLVQEWLSIITPLGRADRIAATFRKFPRSGQAVTVSIAPFQLKDKGMTYSWDGKVTRNKA
jgi:hypothetical protein